MKAHTNDKRRGKTSNVGARRPNSGQNVEHRGKTSHTGAKRQKYLGVRRQTSGQNVLHRGKTSIFGTQRQTSGQNVQSRGKQNAKRRAKRQTPSHNIERRDKPSKHLGVKGQKHKSTKHRGKKYQASGQNFKTSWKTSKRWYETSNIRGNHHTSAQNVERRNKTPNAGGRNPQNISGYVNFKRPGKTSHTGGKPPTLGTDVKHGAKM